MSITTTTTLTRAAGVAAVAAGLLYILIQLVLTIAATFVEVFVLPPLADQAPQYVDDFLATFTGGAVTGDVGSLPVAGLVSAVGYLLLAVGSVATLLVPPLPHSLDRLAFPVGLALAGLGYSLWSEQRRSSQVSVSSVPSARLDLAGVE
jgi:hypothetical protein